MYIPAPDALLIAQHLHEWPDNEVVYLYRMPSDGGYLPTMLSNGYESPGGVAHTDNRLTVLATFDKADMVRLHLVFVGDPDVAEKAQPFLGRDVDKSEWSKAREWLTQQKRLEAQQEMTRWRLNT